MRKTQGRSCRQGQITQAMQTEADSQTFAKSTKESPQAKRQARFEELQLLFKK